MKPSSTPISAKSNFEPPMAEQISSMSRAELEQFALKTWGIKEELEIDGQIDALSGSFSRKAFDDRGHTSLTEYGYDVPIGVLIIDGDGFKNINDTLGHAVGDKVIAAIFSKLENMFPHPNIVGRLGGDESGIITVGLTKEDIKMRFDMLIGKIEVALPDEESEDHIRFTQYLGDKKRVSAALSCGVCIRDKENPYNSLTQMKGLADEDMYKNKKERKASGTDKTRVLNPGESAPGALNIFPNLG